MNPDVVLEVHQLLARYGHAVDHEDPQMIREVFASDGVFDALRCEAGIYEGAEEIIRWFELGKPPHPPFHMTTNVYAYESDGEVRALSKFLVVDPETARPMSGDYEDRIVREDGALRIGNRLAIPRFLDTNWSSKVTF